MQRYNLNTFCFRLHLLWIFIGFESTCTAVVIRVSNTGYDNSSCLASANATTPCKTIKFALDVVKDSNNTDFIFSIEDQVYDLEERVNITQTSPGKNIILKSNHLTGSTIHCMNIFAGFDIGSGLNSVNKTRNINFVNLEFENCGPNFAAAVVIWNSVEINFTNCVFKHNKQAGICGFDSGVVIDSCHFLNNTLNHQTNSTSGGGARFFLRNAISLSVTIKSSIFTLNSVAMNNSTESRWPCRKLSTCNYHLGGGLLIMFQESASGCHVVIQDTIFSSNSAKFGGGVYFADSDMTSRNNFSITNSTFLGNMAVEAGGGLMFTRWDTGSSIRAILKDCIVSENQSKRGAGMNIFFMNNNEKSTDSVLRFDTVVFSNNFGKASTAIRLMTNMPYASLMDVIPEFINCTIVDHSMSSFARTSPFTSQRVNVKFKGRNVFTRNNGGGAAMFQECVINVHGQLIFTNNTGLNGGAVLLESSQIILYPDSELKFLGNEASGLGGAICVFEHVMEELMQWYNPNCFLAYSEANLPPSEWKANISFIENSSMVKGAAIYVSSLQRCLWTKKFPHDDFKTALRWSGNIEYKKNYLFTEALSGPAYDIATDTKRFHLHPTKDNSTVKLAPGQTFHLNLHAVDELGHSTLTLAYISEADDVNRTPKLQLPTVNYLLMPDSSSTIPFSFNAPKKLYNEIQHRKGKNKRKIQIIDFYSTLENRYFFEFELQECRPGFSYSPESKVCECNKQPGILRCDNDGMLYLEEGFWANITSDGKLVTYVCPHNYCNCTPGGSRGCLFDPNNSNKQCSKNREGWLCGKCSGNTSVGLRWPECIHCTKTGWLLPIVIIFVASLCILVIWLNPGISSELRGPLFFFLVLPFIFSPTNHLSPHAFFLAYLFSPKGLLIHFFKACIMKELNNLYEAAFGYAIPVIVLSIFLLAYVLSTNYCLRFKFRRHSMLRSFWLLLVFIYNYLVETSLFILFCPKVGDKHVFFYDGTMECFHGDHLLMAVIAILVLVFLVIPPPIIVFLLTNGYWRVDPQYLNTLTSGLRPECRWWWSVDLCRRVLLVATYALVPNWQTKKILMIFMCVLILAVHSNCQPYIRARANVAESVYLLVLSTLSIMQMIDDQPVKYYVCLVLLVILACHTLVVTGYKGTKFFQRRFDCTCAQITTVTRRQGYNELEGTQIDQSISTETERRRKILDTIFDSF